MINIISYSPSIDVVYQIDNYIAGNTYTQVDSNRNYAGKAINVAKIISQLEEDVSLFGIIPKGDENSFREYLSSYNISANLLTTDATLRINSTILDRKNSTTTHISTNSTPLSPKIAKEAHSKFISNIEDDSNWIISGSLPVGFKDSVYADLITDISKSGGKVTLDTRDNALELGIRAKPLIVKPNLLELESFFGEEIRGVHHIALKGKRLIDMGIEYVFISLGSDGMIALHENDCLLCSPPNVQIINSVGSGDALVAGMSVAMMRNFSFKEICRLAVACGTSNAMQLETGVVDNERIWGLMEEVTVESV